MMKAPGKRKKPRTIPPKIMKLIGVKAKIFNLNNMFCQCQNQNKKEAVQRINSLAELWSKESIRENKTGSNYTKNKERLLLKFFLFNRKFK